MSKRVKYCIRLARIAAILVFFSSQLLFSQNKSDRLNALLNRADHDTTRIRLLFEMGNLYIDGPSDSMIYYYTEGLTLIDKFFVQPDDILAKKGKEMVNHYKNLHFRALMEIGIELFFQGKYEESLDYHFRALDIAREIGDLGIISECYGAIGIVYKNQGAFAEALEYYEQALSAAIELKDTSWMAACYANTGNVYRRLTNYTKALDYFLKALKVFEAEGEKRRVAITYMNIGNVYEDQKDLSTALEYYSRALQLSYETNDQKRIAECLANVGNIYSAKEEYKTARDYYYRSIQINQDLGYNHTVDECYQCIGQTFEMEGLTDEALINYQKAHDIAKKEKDLLTVAEVLGHMANIFLIRKSYETALDYGGRSLEISLETADPHNIKNAYLYLSMAWEGMDNTTKALNYYKLFSDAKDSIFNSDKYKAIKDLEMKYQSEKQEQQLVLLTERNQLQQLKLERRYRLIWGLGILFALILLIIHLLLRQKELKNRHMAIELEQKLLRSQMNPHFIFNSLIAIQSFIYRKDAVQAGDYLAKFAELIRITLESTRNDFVLLEKEIKMLNIYFELQALRFENKFRYSIEVDGSIDPSSLRVPPMLAQPFIENAIEHGIRHMEKEGFLSVMIERSNGTLKMRVEDNGIGREMAGELEINKKHTSMATSITRDRLEILGKKFNKKYILEFTDLKDDHFAGAGTRVLFTFPFIVST